MSLKDFRQISFAVAAALAIIVVNAGLAAAQGGRGLLLADDFGELCTMCEAAIRCEPSWVSESERSTIYVFHKKSFFGQMATIIDFLPFIGKRDTERRPVTIFRLAGDALEREISIASLDMARARIDVGTRRIGRREGDWMTAAGSKIGTCRRIDVNDAPNVEGEYE